MFSVSKNSRIYKYLLEQKKFYLDLKLQSHYFNIMLKINHCLQTHIHFFLFFSNTGLLRNFQMAKVIKFIFKTVLNLLSNFTQSIITLSQHTMSFIHSEVPVCTEKAHLHSYRTTNKVYTPTMPVAMPYNNCTT